MAGKFSKTNRNLLTTSCFAFPKKSFYTTTRILMNPCQIHFALFIPYKTYIIWQIHRQKPEEYFIFFSGDGIIPNVIPVDIRQIGRLD